MTKLPIYEAVKAYADLKTARFHMPGHKGMLNELDVTEVPGTDNLHSPAGAILESETLCAKALGGRDGFELCYYDGFGHAAYDTAPDYKARIMAFLKGNAVVSKVIRTSC